MRACGPWQKQYHLCNYTAITLHLPPLHYTALPRNTTHLDMHAHAACACPMPRHTPHAHAACPGICHMRMLHPHAQAHAHAHAPCNNPRLDSTTCACRMQKSQDHQKNAHAISACRMPRHTSHSHAPRPRKYPETHPEPHNRLEMNAHGATPLKTKCTNKSHAWCSQSEVPQVRNAWARCCAPSRQGQRCQQVYPCLRGRGKPIMVQSRLKHALTGR